MIFLNLCILPSHVRSQRDKEAKILQLAIQRTVGDGLFHVALLPH